MIVLHGTWKLPEKIEDRGDFFIWGESSSVSSIKRRGSPSKVSAGKPRIHPFQAANKDLLRIIESLYTVNGDVIVKKVHPENALLLLPSHSNSKSPQASPDLLREEENDGTEEKVSLSPWQVNGLSILPEDAVLMLSSLSGAWTENNSTVIGTDLRFWSKVSMKEYCPGKPRYRK